MSALSKVQLLTLERMASGQAICSFDSSVSGRGEQAYWDGQPGGERRPSVATVSALAGRGLIMDENAARRMKYRLATGSRWVITDGGRAALAKARGAV